MRDLASGLVLALCMAGVSHAGMVSLEGTANGSSRISEFNLTGAFAQIDFGDGSPGDADGAYLIGSEAGPLGTNLDIFPNETSFGVGSLSFDDSGISGSGTETVAATAIDLSALWAPGSSSTDISAVALSDFFFSAPAFFTFGPLDASDTVTFVDGAIDSVNLEIDASFSLFLSSTAGPTVFNGTFSIVGDQFSLLIDETLSDVQTDFGVFPESRLRIDISGTVSAIPAPGTGLLGLALCGGALRRRR
ncbi:MAG: hypothetical protein AAGB51_11260 [Planctomycetota bacterium]